LVNAGQQRGELIGQLDALTLEVRGLKDQIRSDEASVIRTRIAQLKQNINKHKTELSQLQPIIAQLSAKLNELEERQRNEVAYRNSERNRAENGLRDAEMTLSTLKGDAEKARQNLDILQMDVEALTNSIKDDEGDLVKCEKARVTLQTEFDTIEQELRTAKVCSTN
jgi:chromosome segregation ATPase